MAGFDPDALLDSIGIPQAPSFDPDSLLDSIGVPAGPKRRRPATLAGLDEDGPNSSPPMDRPGDPDYVPGRLHLGNIDLSRRPTVRNADGSISTVRSISASFGNAEVLLPTVSDDGRILSNADAIDAYKKTGRHLGIFDSPDAATAYAQRLHQDQDRLYSTRRRDLSQLGAGLRAAGGLPATTAAPEHSPLYNLLGLNVMGDTLAGAGRTALNTVKAIPEELNRGTSGVESSMGTLARASGEALERAADKPVFAGPRLPGAQQGLLAPLYHGLADPLKSFGGELEDIGGRQAEQADLKLKTNPEADSIISRAVQGVPMLTGLAMTGGAAGATAGMGLLGAGAGLREAERAGATPGQAWGAAALQGGADAALGQIGSIPAIRGLLHGVPVSGAADAVLALAKQGGKGALQSVGMDVAHGLARKLTYAKEVGLDPAEMAKNAAAQALLQGALEAPGIEITPKLGGKELPTVAPPPELFHGGKAPLAIDPNFAPPDYVHGSGTGARFGHGLYLTDSPAVASTYGPEVTPVRASPGHQLLDLNQPFTASLWKAFTGARTSRWGDLSPGDRTFLDEVSREGPAAFPTMESFFDFPGLGRPRRVGDPAVITDAIQQRLAAAGYTGLIRKGESGVRADGAPHQEVLFFRPEPGDVAASEPAPPPRPPSDGEPPEGGSAPPTLPPPPSGGAAPPPAGAGVAPFRGTWPEFLSSRDMDRGDFAVQTAAGKKALRAEYDAALDAHREQAAAARASAVPPRSGILGEPEPVHPDVEAAVDAVAPPRLTKEALPVGLLDTLSMSSNAASSFPSAEVFGRLVEGKPLRLAKSDLERDVGQAAKGLWPTGLLKSTADIQLLHDTLAGGGDLDAAVAALARNAPQKAQRFEPPLPAKAAEDIHGLFTPPAKASGTAVTEAGTEIPFRYRAVSADDLVASHDTALNVNPAYPAELQPRDRGRIASRLQIDSMVNSLDPERLGENRMVSQGAPVVGPDSIVESGNARTIALKRAYASGHPNGAAYASWVRENAPRFGLDPATLPERPVLVRERLGDLGDRAAFAREANAQSLAGMSATEQAGVDALRLTPELLRQFVPNGSGNVASAGNRDFVRGFLAGIPPHEAAPLVDATGQLSREGQARLHGALLAGAYQDPGLVSRMTEATDDNTRGLSRALAVEAPAFIGLRQGAERGAVHPGLDLGPDIATAANKLSELRASGQKVHDYLAQGGLFGSELSPEGQRLLSLFDEFKRSPARIAETLHRYVELATAAGDPRQASLMPTEPPSKAELLERASATWNQAGGLLPFEEPSHASRPEPAAAVADHLAATVPPEHVAAFVPGDSGAAESPTNATALRETVADLPAVHPGSAAGTEGTRGWLLGSALGDLELAHRLTSSEDHTLSRLADPLASVAPSLAEAPPELRGYLRQAVDAYVKVREEGNRGFPPAGPPVAEDQLRGNFRALPLGRPGLESVADGHQTQLIHRDGSGRPTAYAWYSVDHSGTPRLTDLYRNPEARNALGGSAGLLALLNHLGSIDARLGRPGELELSPDAFRALTRSLDATRLGSTPAGRFLEAARNELVGGAEIARLGRLLGADAPEEVHHIASFLAENAQHPESVAQYLHRVAELHQTNSGTGGEGGLSLSQLLEMAADREQRQAAGSVIPLESSNLVAKAVIVSSGEAGFIDLRGPRFGEASPIRRWFTREGKFAAMGDELASHVKTLVAEKDFQVKATEKRVVANVRDYGTALRDQMETLKHADVAPPGSPIGPDSSIEDVHSYVRAGIMGENDLSAVGPPLQEAAAALRAHLTEQSRAYLQRPDLPASLKAVIGENLDSYFPRTFERITDPKGYAKGIKKDFEAARDASAPRGQSWKISEAADWAQQQNPTMTREDAEGYAFKLLMDDPQAAYAVARGTQAQKAAMGTESRGNLKARLGLPEELDNLLGLHQDPTRSYQIGAMRAARDLATYDLHSKVAQMGSADPARPDGLTPDGQRPIFVDRPTPDLPVRIGGKGPLAEKFTSEQVAAAIRGTQTISAAHTGFIYYYLKVNGAIKTGKIAMNVPMGVARNMLTWPSLLLAGGHWVEAFPAKYAWETIKTLPLAIEANLGTREGGVLRFAKRLAHSIPLANGETVGDHMFPRGQKLADLRAEVLRKTELGVLGQSTAADDLRYYTGMENEPDASSRAGKVIRDLGGIWSGEHDMGKDIVFEAERAGLAKANPDLSPDEIDKWARDRMLATTPSRSEVSEGVRAIRAAPGISPFPTFAAERFRNMKNNAMIAWEDLNSTNPQMKVLGAKRAAGLLTALALAGGGASWMLQKLWNTGKEDADALREFLAAHLKDHQIAVSDRTGGKIRYADISPQMPLTGVTDPAMALLRGIHQGSTRDGMIDAAQEFARPFLDEEFALKTALDLRGNQQSEGNLFDSATNLARQNPRDTQRRQIYLPGGPPGVVAGQIGKYVWHQDAPAMGLEAERFARANNLLPNTNARGKRYTNQDEMAALGGVRFNTIDMNAALTSAGYNLKDALTESKRHFTGERSSSQNDPKTVLEARAAANERWKNAFEIGLKKVAAARQLRISDFAIRQNLRIAGVPPIVIGQLMAGRYSALPLRMPYRVPQDYVGAGTASAGDEE